MARLLTLSLLLLGLCLTARPLQAADDDDSGDDDDSAVGTPDDAATYGWLCGLGGAGSVPAAGALLLTGLGLAGRRTRGAPQRP